jgi:hypothetical protein
MTGSNQDTPPQHELYVLISWWRVFLTGLANYRQLRHHLSRADVDTQRGSYIDRELLRVPHTPSRRRPQNLPGPGPDPQVS